MNLLSCITSVKEIIPLKKSGADEIYFAYREIYNYSNSPALYTMSEVKKAITIAHKLSMNIFLAANDIMFDTRNKKVIENIKKIISYGVDGVIVSSVGLLYRLNELNIKTNIHISSLNPVFNTQTAKMFSEFNIKRIILPNQLSAYEAKNIINFCRSKNIDTEIFYFRYFGCPYINGYCYLHGDRYFNVSSEAPLCRINNNQVKNIVKPINNSSNNYLIKKIKERVAERFSTGGPPRIMTASEFFDYYMMGVRYVKYGTRTDDTRSKIINVYNIRKSIDYIKDLISKYSYDDAKKMFINMAVKGLKV